MANFLFTGFQESGLASYNPSVASVARSVARDHLFNPDTPTIGSFHLPPISLNHHPQHHPHLTVRPTVPSSTARISRITSTTPVTLAPRTSNLFTSTVDHPNHANMRPYFHFDYNDTVLFNSWVLRSTWDTLLTCLAFILLAILYEAIKCYREHLYKRLSFTVRKALPVTISSPTNYSQHLTSSYSNSSQLHHHLHHTPAGGGNINQTNLRRDSNIGLSPQQMSPASALGVSTSSSLGENRKRMSSNVSSNLNIRIFSIPHLVQTFLHLVQVILAYTLMLGFMTFNAWICLSIIFGASLGYYLFYWRKITIVHVTDCH